MSLMAAAVIVSFLYFDSSSEVVSVVAATIASAVKFSGLNDANGDLNFLDGGGCVSSCCIFAG